MSFLPEHLMLLKNEIQKRDLTLQEILHLLGDEGHYLFILIFILPFIQPIPLYGLSTPVGISMMIIAYFLFRHQDPWLPQKLQKKIVKKEILEPVFNVLDKLFRLSRKVHRQRLQILTDSRLFQKINAFIIAMNALLLALPLPIPFSNTVPAISILLLAVGAIQKDGLFILFSYFWHFIVIASFWQILLLVVQFLQSHQFLT